MPSYKTSMLSLMVLHYFYSLILLMILTAIMAMLAPDTYKLVSEEKLILAIILGAYISLWVWLFSAYLQRSQITDNNKTSENSNTDTTSTTTTTTITPKEEVVEPTIEEDLSLNKFEAYDPSDK